MLHNTVICIPKTFSTPDVSTPAFPRAFSIHRQPTTHQGHKIPRNVGTGDAAPCDTPFSYHITYHYHIYFPRPGIQRSLKPALSNVKLELERSRYYGFSGLNEACIVQYSSTSALILNDVARKI
eukprot:g12150.t1